MSLTDDLAAASAALPVRLSAKKDGRLEGDAAERRRSRKMSSRT